MDRRAEATLAPLVENLEQKKNVSGNVPAWKKLSVHQRQVVPGLICARVGMNLKVALLGGVGEKNTTHQTRGAS